MEYPLEAGVDVPRQGFVGRVGSLARHYLVGWISSS
jgi:D-alanyl-D-alanine carboxypeptidase (penicillin-binding protein 5/6)